MKHKKEGFILFYTLILLVVVSIMLIAVHNSSLSNQRYLSLFYNKEQEILLKYSIKKATIPENTNIILKNSRGKDFQLNDYQ